MATKIELPIVNPNYEDAAPEGEGAAAGAAAPEASASGLLTRAEGGDVMSEIEKETKEHRVFLYMKGTPQMPQCGFSARVVQILGHIGVPYAAFNVLADMEKREAIKVYAEWPTIPQLYVEGEFVGGCDIVTEMFQSGELQELLGAE